MRLFHVAALTAMLSAMSLTLACMIDMETSPPPGQRRVLYAAAVGLPLALPLAFYRVLSPAARGARWRDEGRCAQCGYDLRSTPGACPECGTTPPPQPVQPRSAPPRKWTVRAIRR